MKNAHTNSAHTLLLLIPRAKNVVVGYGRSSDLLPWLNAFPKTFFSSCKRSYRSLSGKVAVQYVFLFLPLLKERIGVRLEFTAAGTVSDFHRIPFYRSFWMNTSIPKSVAKLEKKTKQAILYIKIKQSSISILAISSQITVSQMIYSFFFNESSSE